MRESSGREMERKCFELNVFSGFETRIYSIRKIYEKRLVLNFES